MCKLVWDEELCAHDMQLEEEDVGESLLKLVEGTWVDKKCPQRVRLRNVLDAVYAVEDSGKKLDLQPLRRLVGLLVEANSGTRSTAMAPSILRC